VRFLGSESGRAHARWFRILAESYDTLTPGVLRRPVQAAVALHDLFRRRGPVRDVLDVACGTFSIDIGLVKRGYRVVGRDLSKDMIRVARRNAREAGIGADIAAADMRTLRLGRSFDALACLGTAFNYLASPADIRRGLGAFRRHLRQGGLLVLDTTNFEPWIDAPMNVRAEIDHRAKDGTRLAIFTFNGQDRSRSLHFARFITAVQRGRAIDLAFDEAPLRIWTKERLAAALRQRRFQPVEWWGDLRRTVAYDRRRSPRLVAVAVRT
jgi:SAM-dependent methyltransferase